MPEITEAPHSLVSSMPLPTIISISGSAASLPHSEDQKENSLPKRPGFKNSTINKPKDCGDGCGGCPKAATCKTSLGAQSLSSKERAALVQFSKRASEKPGEGFVPPPDDGFKPSKGLKLQQKPELQGAEKRPPLESKTNYRPALSSQVTALTTQIPLGVKIETLPQPKMVPVTVANELRAPASAYRIEEASSKPLEVRTDSSRILQSRLELKSESAKSEFPRPNYQEAKVTQPDPDTSRLVMEAPRFEAAKQSRQENKIMQGSKPLNEVAAIVPVATRSTNVTAAVPTNYPLQNSYHSTPTKPHSATSLPTNVPNQIPLVASPLKVEKPASAVSPTADMTKIDQSKSNRMVATEASQRNDIVPMRPTTPFQTSTRINSSASQHFQIQTSKLESGIKVSTQASSTVKVEVAATRVPPHILKHEKTVVQPLAENQLNILDRAPTAGNKGPSSTTRPHRMAEQIVVRGSVVPNYLRTEAGSNLVNRKASVGQVFRSRLDVNGVNDSRLASRSLQDVTESRRSLLRSELRSTTINNRVSVDTQLRRIAIVGNGEGRELALRQIRELGRSVIVSQNKISSQDLERMRDLCARIRQSDPKNVDVIKLDRIASSLLLNRQLSRLEQVFSNSNLSQKNSVRLVNRELQDMLRSLSRTSSNSIPLELVKNIRQSLDRLARLMTRHTNSDNRDLKQIEMIARQLRVLLDQKARLSNEHATRKGGQESGSEVKRLFKIDSAEQSILKRISQLQETISRSRGTEKKGGERILPINVVDIKERSLKEQLSNLQNKLSLIRRLRTDLVVKLERNSIVTSNQVENKTQRPVNTAAYMFKKEIFAILQNKQALSPASLLSLASKLTNLIRAANESRHIETKDLLKIKNLEAVQQMLREGQELSGAMIQELFYHLGEIFEDWEDSSYSPLKIRKRSIKLSTSVKKDQRKSLGLRWEESKRQIKEASKKEQKSTGMREVKNTKTGSLITGATSAPSKQLDVVQSIEKDGKRNSYWEQEDAIMGAH